MAAFNLFLASVPTNEWTVEGGGTALEAIGKETVEPTNPSTAKQLKSTAANKKAEATVTIPGALKTALEAGEKIVAATLHINVATASTAGKTLKFGFIAAGVFSEPEIPKEAPQKWLTVSLSKAQAEELNLTTLATLKLLAEHLLSKPLSFYELYLSVETEAVGKTTYEAAVSIRTGAATRTQANALAAGSVSLRAGCSISAQAKNIASGSVALATGSAVKTQANMVALATMDHPTPRVTPFVTGHTLGISLEAGASVQVAGQRVVQASVALRAGSRTATASRMLAQSKVSLRAGSRVAVSAKRIVLGAVLLRNGATLVISVEGTQFVESWTAAGDSEIVHTTAGDMPVTYTTAGDEVAVPTYAGDE
jgi:hypothetical protein